MVFDIYSKREAARTGETPDIYRYDDMPVSLKNQIILLFREQIGMGTRVGSKSARAYDGIMSVMKHEYGLLKLVEGEGNKYARAAIEEFFLAQRDISRCLDYVELGLKAIERGLSDRDDNHEYSKKVINVRLKESGLGFRFDQSMIIRIDSEHIHSEVIKPALSLLSDKDFAGANDEYRKAHAFYCNGDYKSCLSESLKAFESFMMSICRRHEWAYEKPTASVLIGILFGQELIPATMQSQFTSLANLLKSGLPAVRNAKSGHGQGPDVTLLPEYFASFGLHQTASLVLFLGKASDAYSANAASK